MCETEREIKKKRNNTWTITNNGMKKDTYQSDVT